MDSNTRSQIDDLTQSLKSLRHENSNLSAANNIEKYTDMFSKYDLAVTRISREQAILKSLCFEYMTVRHSRIVEAHVKTFDWIFKASLLPLADPRSQIKFVEWLHFSGGIYWASGKPGSGKSTLMKYLSENLQTSRELKMWARDSTLVTASFYFWNAGTAMQKSHQGLLQSILFEVLNQRPDMIPSICPALWEKSDRGYIATSAWTLKSLSSSFELLKDQTSFGKKYCFFIDGLDEYEGDHFDLIDILKDLALSPNIKLCLSSRPWNCFEDAFGKDIDRKLYLQDLTREDIYLYAQSRLEVHVILGQNDMHYQRLISEIVNRAQGVFLWVSLVVLSLREGLANGDSVSILETRLRSLPTDLEPFFKHIIESVDTVYQKQMALTFQAALRMNEPLLLIVYSFLEEEDPDFAIHLPVGIMDEVMARTRQTLMRRRLNGRYKGLLEVSSDVHQINGRYGCRVEFLHRTVRDDLMMKDTQNLLNGLLDQGRNSCFSLVRALLAHLKTMPYSPDVSSLLNQLIQFSRQGEVETGVPDFEALDEFDSCIRMKWGEGSIPGTNTSFLELTTREGFVLYVKHRIEAKPSVVTEYPLLIAALDVCLTNEHLHQTSMVEMLLKHGANPNQQHQGTTVWNKFMDWYPHDQQRTKREFWRQLFLILIIHGMDICLESTLLFPVVDQYQRWSNGDLSEVSKTLEMLFAHGIDPNQNHQGSTAWQQFLMRALDSALLLHKDYSSFFLGVMKSFLRYGADTQCRISCKSTGYIFEDENARTVSEVIGGILLRIRGVTSIWDRRQEASETEILDLLQSEIRNVEAHNAYCEANLNAAQDEYSGSFENHEASIIQAFPTFATRDDYVRPGYGESNRMETPRGARNIMKMRQGSSFRRSQVHSGGQTCILGNPKVSKHSELLPRSANARAMVRGEHEFAVESYTWEFSEYQTDFRGKDK
jgi:NACHT domain